MSAKVETVDVSVIPLENIRLFIQPETEAFCVYKGVFVFFDDDLDTRVLDFIDELSEHRREKLYAVGEHEGSLSMVWKCKPPKGMQEDDHVTVCGDVWHIFQSVESGPLSMCVKRTIPAPFNPIEEKVCVVRGDSYMNRQWLSSVGFRWDTEAKVWTQMVQVDAMGRAKFCFSFSKKFKIWDLSDFTDECPRWDPEKMSVSLE